METDVIDIGQIVKEIENAENPRDYLLNLLNSSRDYIAPARTAMERIINSKNKDLIGRIGIRDIGTSMAEIRLCRKNHYFLQQKDGTYKAMNGLK